MLQPQLPTNLYQEAASITQTPLVWPIFSKLLLPTPWRNQA